MLDDQHAGYSADDVPQVLDLRTKQSTNTMSTYGREALSARQSIANLEPGSNPKPDYQEFQTADPSLDFSSPRNQSNSTFAWVAKQGQRIPVVAKDSQGHKECLPQTVQHGLTLFSEVDNACQIASSSVTKIVNSKEKHGESGVVDGKQLTSSRKPESFSTTSCLAVDDELWSAMHWTSIADDKAVLIPFCSDWVHL